MEYSFEPDRWGSVVSNMAFTNHLHYANHHDRIQLEPYLRKFKEIIASLRVGGSFYYAPSVPFIEERLETNTYRVERFEVFRDIQSTRITRVAR